MSDEIIKVLDALSEKAGIAVNWTSENVVPYLQKIGSKLVNYELATSIIWIVISILAIIGCGFVIKYLYKEGEKSSRSWTDDCSGYYTFLMFLVGLAIAAFLICGVIVQLFDIVKCITFPEKIIIDYLQEIYSSIS